MKKNLVAHYWYDHNKYSPRGGGWYCEVRDYEGDLIDHSELITSEMDFEGLGPEMESEVIEVILFAHPRAIPRRHDER